MKSWTDFRSFDTYVAWSLNVAWKPEVYRVPEVRSKFFDCTKNEISSKNYVEMVKLLTEASSWPLLEITETKSKSWVFYRDDVTTRVWTMLEAINVKRRKASDS